jgi:hypothetical protein
VGRELARGAGTRKWGEGEHLELDGRRPFRQPVAATGPPTTQISPASVDCMFGTATYDFRGRVALIAGASRGIGAEAAKAFARAGATVVITARSAEPLAGVVDEIEAAGGTAMSQTGDLTDAEFVRDLIGETIGRFGRLDAAFNNATGGTMPAPLAELDINDFDGAVAGNIRTTFLGCKYQIPAMLKSGGGASGCDRTLAVLRRSLLHHRSRHPARRRPDCRLQAAPDVPARRAHAARPRCGLR